MQWIEPEWLWTAQGLRTGWSVQIESGHIVGVGPAKRHHEVSGEQGERIVLPGRLLLPGLVNAHSHAFQRAFRGHVQWSESGSDDFWSWRQAMYATANALDPAGVEAVSALAFLEMIEAGITHVGEFHYLHHAPGGQPYDNPNELAERVIAAARRVGLRITLLRVVYGRNAPGEPLRAEQLRFRDASARAALDAIDALRAHEDEAVRIGLAPHSIRAVPVEWLRDLSGFDGVVHAHVAEQPGEVQTSLREHGVEPLRVFADAGLVSDRFTAVHLTHPADGDVALLRAAGARICVCPTTELDLGDGFLPVHARELGLCLGSDSQARIDLFEEARSLELHARGIARRRNVMAVPGERHALAERLLGAATHEGAASLGLRRPGQGIVAGMAADLVSVDLRRPAALGVPPLEAAVFVASPDWVDQVWVAGEPRLVEGRHPLRDAICDAARPYI